MASTSTRATEALRSAGAPFTLHAYDYAPGHGGIGRQAAEALGIAPSRLLKTLMVLVDGGAACALVPSDRELSPKRLALALGGRTATLMPMDEAERVSGYVVGGISPFGQRRRIAVGMDIAALQHEQVFINAGRRGLQLSMSPHDTVRVLTALVAPLCR